MHMMNNTSTGFELEYFWFLEDFMTLHRFVSGEIGWVEVVVGCMFSGKTEESIRRAKTAMYARQKVAIFKHRHDCGRYDPIQLASHGGLRLMATPVDNVKQIKEQLSEDTEVIVIDEGQFFDDTIVSFVIHQRHFHRRRIIVSALNMDFTGKPFGPVPELLAIANEIVTLTAICTECRNPASFSQKLIASTEQITIGDKKLYAARCELHWNPEGSAL